MALALTQALGYSVAKEGKFMAMTKDEALELLNHFLDQHYNPLAHNYNVGIMELSSEGENLAALAGLTEAQLLAKIKACGVQEAFMAVQDLMRGLRNRINARAEVEAMTWDNTIGG